MSRSERIHHLKGRSKQCISQRKPLHHSVRRPISPPILFYRSPHSDLFTSPTLYQRLKIRTPRPSGIPFYIAVLRSTRISFCSIFRVLELRRKVLENGSPLRCITVVLTPLITIGSALGKLAHTISGLPVKRRYPGDMLLAILQEDSGDVSMAHGRRKV